MKYLFIFLERITNYVLAIQTLNHANLAFQSLMAKTCLSWKMARHEVTDQMLRF